MNIINKTDLPNEFIEELAKNNNFPHDFEITIQNEQRKHKFLWWKWADTDDNCFSCNERNNIIYLYFKNVGENEYENCSNKFEFRYCFNCKKFTYYELDDKFNVGFYARKQPFFRSQNN